MIDRAVTALGVSGSIVLIAASVVINAEFAYSRGVTEYQAITYAGAAAAADLLKSLCAFFALWSLQARAYMRAAASIGFAALVTIYSLSSAIGLIAESRDARSTDRQTRNERLADVAKQRSDAEAELKGIKSHRSVTELEAAIRTKLAFPILAGRRVRGTLGRVTDECETVDRATRESCVELGALREELGRAKTAERVRKAIDDLRQEQTKLGEKGAGREPDGQVRTLAAILRWAVGEMNLALAILLALVIEAGSSLGLFVATGHNLGSLRNQGDKGRGAGYDAQPALAQAIPVRSQAEALPTLGVEAYWMDRLFPAPGQKVSFSDIFADYRAHCGRRSFTALDADVFQSVFEAICQEIRLKTAHGFAFGVRIGEERDVVQSG